MSSVLRPSSSNIRSLLGCWTPRRKGASEGTWLCIGFPHRGVLQNRFGAIRASKSPSCASGLAAPCKWHGCGCQMKQPGPQVSYFRGPLDQFRAMLKGVLPCTRFFTDCLLSFGEVRHNKLGQSRFWGRPARQCPQS